MVLAHTRGMSETPKRDSGKGLRQLRNTPSHWTIEGYDVYIGHAWEGTHTSRWANIEKDSVHLDQVRTLSDARAWIREQVGK